MNKQGYEFRIRGAFRRIRALTIKEFYQILYDPSSIFISFIIPFILMFLYGYGVSLDLNNVNIGLVMEDTTPGAQSFAQSLTDSTYFSVIVVRDRRELVNPLLEGSIKGFVVIPPYFSQFRAFSRDGIKAPIQIVTDGGEPNTASFIQNYVVQVWNKWLEQEKMSGNVRGLPLIGVQPRYWFNDELSSHNFVIPGSLAIIMTLMGTLLTALVIAREWERGTMEALMATPVHIYEILVSKLISYYVLAMGSMTCCVIGAVFFYEVPFRGSYFVLGVVTTVFLFTALGTGLLFSTLTKNQLAASQAAQVGAFLPAYMLSGIIFEIASMPKIIQFITNFVPAKYFVSAILSIFLVGNVWGLLIQNTLIMFFMGLVIFFFTSRLIVKRLD